MEATETDLSYLGVVVVSNSTYLFCYPGFVVCSNTL